VHRYAGRGGRWNLYTRAFHYLASSGVLIITHSTLISELRSDMGEEIDFLPITSRLLLY
jgi:hypothetical protein